MTALSRAAMALMLVSAVGCNDGPVDEIVADAALDATVDGDLPDAEAMDMEIPPEDAAPPRPDARPDLRCEVACDALAACAVEAERCPGVGPDDEAAYRAACVPACEANAAVLGLVDEGDCEATVARVRALSADFNDRCQVPFSLTVLHTGGGYDDMLPAPAEVVDEGSLEVGGAARAAALMAQLRAEAGTDGVLAVHTGDVITAGRAFDAAGEVALDAAGILMAGAEVDVIALGDRDLDLGPDTLSAVMAQWLGLPLVASNLVVDDEPALRLRAEAGALVQSTVVETGGARIGVVAVVPDGLAERTSPGLATAQVPLSAMILQVLELQSQGVDKVILVSHLERFEEDRILAVQAIGVDVVISAGGGVYLGGEMDPRLVEDTLDPARPYPTTVIDGAGAPLPVVAVAGGLDYVGRLVVTFNDRGEVIAVDEASAPVGVWVGPTVAQATLAQLQAELEAPLGDALAAPGITLGDVDVIVSGVNSTRQEVNAGNLIADAVRWQVAQRAERYGVEAPTVALVDGGSILPATLPMGADALTTAGVVDLWPSPAVVGVVELNRVQLKALLEHGLSEPQGNPAERFPQISGMRLVRDLGGSPRTVNPETGAVSNSGSRVWELRLDDGTFLVREGRVQDPSTGIVQLATTAPIAEGLWGYPLETFTTPGFVRVGATVPQAIAGFVVEALEGVISVEDYPDKAISRITDRNP